MYCIALGLKNVKHRLVFLGNDDIDTPTALVGKKIAPIFEMNGAAMMESLDIIAKIDSDETFGPVNAFKPSSGRKDIKEWQSKVANDNRFLQRPRYMLSPILPEFQQKDARDAFVKNHPLPPYEKDVWKNELSYEDRWEKFHAAMELSPQLILNSNQALAELDQLIFCEDYCTEGGLSLDDIDLWSRLRSVTLVKGIQWPSKLRAYMNNLAARGDVPLYDSVAI